MICRRSGQATWLDNLCQDLKFASRQLLRNPGFAAGAVLLLALGIGVNTAIFTIIPLYLAALFSSYIATAAIVTKFFALSSGTYTHYFHLFLPPIDILYSLIKAVIFAIVVTLIHCYYGYNASGGPAGVGVASGRAIRLSIVTVVVLNLFLSLLFWGGGDTVRLA